MSKKKKIIPGYNLPFTLEYLIIKAHPAEKYHGQNNRAVGVKIYLIKLPYLMGSVLIAVSLDIRL